MDGGAATGVEDIVRRNIAALRSKASLTQQELADEMLLRGIQWTRETVAQVETTNRRLGFAEAIAVAACLDVPLARLTATGADVVGVGDSQWSASYLGAAIAGTIGDTFSPASYATPVGPDDASAGAPWEGYATETPEGGGPEPVAPAPRRTAERIERRLRLRVTASDVDATAQQLWSRSLEAEREQRVAERRALTGGSAKAIRGHVSRDLDREIAHEMEQRQMADEDAPSGSAPIPPGPIAPAPAPSLSQDEVNWEATRLNIILANKGYSDSDVTRWWNFTRHRELDDATIAEAWRAGRYREVSRLIESLPESQNASHSSSPYEED